MSNLNIKPVDREFTDKKQIKKIEKYPKLLDTTVIGGFTKSIEQCDRFRITPEAYIIPLLDIESIGGLGEKDKKDPDKGAIISDLNQDQLKGLITDELLQNAYLGLLPSRENLMKMSEYKALKNANFIMGLLTLIADGEVTIDILMDERDRDIYKPYDALTDIYDNDLHIKHHIKSLRDSHENTQFIDTNLLGKMIASVPIEEESKPEEVVEEVVEPTATEYTSDDLTSEINFSENASDSYENQESDFSNVEVNYYEETVEESIEDENQEEYAQTVSDETLEYINTQALQPIEYTYQGSGVEDIDLIDEESLMEYDSEYEYNEYEPEEEMTDLHTKLLVSEHEIISKNNDERFKDIDPKTREFIINTCSIELFEELDGSDITVDEGRNLLNIYNAEVKTINHYLIQEKLTMENAMIEKYKSTLKGIKKMINEKFDLSNPETAIGKKNLEIEEAKKVKIINLSDMIREELKQIETDYDNDKEDFLQKVRLEESKKYDDRHKTIKEEKIRNAESRARIQIEKEFTEKFNDLNKERLDLIEVETETVIELYKDQVLRDTVKSFREKINEKRSEFSDKLDSTSREIQAQIKELIETENKKIDFGKAKEELFESKEQIKNEHKNELLEIKERHERERQEQQAEIKRLKLELEEEFNRKEKAVAKLQSEHLQQINDLTVKFNEKIEKTDEVYKSLETDRKLKQEELIRKEREMRQAIRDANTNADRQIKLTIGVSVVACLLIALGAFIWVNGVAKNTTASADTKVYEAIEAYKKQETQAKSKEEEIKTIVEQVKLNLENKPAE